MHPSVTTQKEYFGCEKNTDNWKYDKPWNNMMWLGFYKQIEQRIESINKCYAKLDEIEMPTQNVDLENETANELKKGPQTKRTTVNT